MSRSAFRRELDARNPDPGSRRVLFVAYDQLNDRIGPLAREDPNELAIVLVESPNKAARRPYHRQKLLLLLANLRHFALEQAERGVFVHHVVARSTYAGTLRDFAREHGSLRMMEAAERELRVELRPLVREGLIEVVPHEGWLTSDEDFDRALAGNRRWRMDSFYRHVRRARGVLMEDSGEPVGGRFSFDHDNRESWKGAPPAPSVPPFATDEIKDEVVDLVLKAFPHHPGEPDPTAIPATRFQIDAAWGWALQHCMEFFGPYEDAMSEREGTLFHTRISPLLNLSRLLAREVLADVEACDAPLQSREGFIRQVLGWREFLRHVHRRTDGFREIPEEAPTETRSSPGDGGYADWRAFRGERKSWGKTRVRDLPAGIDGGAAPAALGAGAPLPPAFWGAPSGLNCLDRVVEQVWKEGYSHHITRLMILGNLATLLDLSPRDLTDWFWVAYIDAYDWVVEPNVLGMATFSLGELLTTKPYVSGAAYIAKMSDYCRSCAFDPKRNCPITRLYWAFLDRHRPQLKDNARLAMPLRSLTKRPAKRRDADRAVFAHVHDRLGAGEPLDPEAIEERLDRE